MPDKKIVIIVSAILVLFFLWFVLTKVNSTGKNSQKPSVSTTASTKPASSSSPASKPAPVTISTVQGNITSLTSSSVTISSEGKTKTFSISATKDFQKVTSGTVAGGDAKTVPSSAVELKTNQQILIIYEVKSTNAKAIYILK